MENKIKRNRPLNKEKREAIIKASIKEFYIKGYEGSSMDTISKEANVSKATVYNHFKNKEDLFLTLAYILLERLEESFRYEYNYKKSIKSQLREIALKELAFINDDENSKLIQTMLIVLMQKNEIGQKLLKDVKDVGLAMTALWFEKAKEDKKLEFEDSIFTAKQFMGMIKSFTMYPQMYGTPKLTEKEEIYLIDQTVEMIIKLYAK